MEAGEKANGGSKSGKESSATRWSGCPGPAILEMNLASEQSTRQFARSLANALRSGDVVALHGGLGVGKTVFARAVIQELDDPGIEVVSPTFTLVQSYGPVTKLGCLVHHLDLFRIDDPCELMELGLADCFADGVSLVEWPEKLGMLLPAESLSVHLFIGDANNSRKIVVHGSDSWAGRLRGVGIA